jgi:hypothetical protein
MKKYIFHSACFDKELFRRQVMILNDHSIDFQIVDKSNAPSARAPLSSFFEAEIHVLENDFEIADRLLKSITD